MRRMAWLFALAADILLCQKIFFKYLEWILFWWCISFIQFLRNFYRILWLKKKQNKTPKQSFILDKFVLSSFCPFLLHYYGVSDWGCIFWKILPELSNVHYAVTQCMLWAYINSTEMHSCRYTIMLPVVYMSHVHTDV